MRKMGGESGLKEWWVNGTAFNLSTKCPDEERGTSIYTEE